MSKTASAGVRIRTYGIYDLTGLGELHPRTDPVLKILILTFPGRMMPLDTHQPETRRTGGIIALNHTETEELTCLLETMTGWP